MPRSRTLSRALVAGLAIAAIAAPTALARPIQDPPTKAPAVDLRMPDTKDAAAQSQQRSDTDGVQTSSLAGTTSPPAVYWAYDYQAQDPKTAPAVGRQHEAGAGARHRWRRQRHAVGHDRHRPRSRAARRDRRRRGGEPDAPLRRRGVALE